MKYIIKASIVAAMSLASFAAGCSKLEYNVRANSQPAPIVKKASPSYNRAPQSVDKDVLDLKMMKAIMDPVQKMIGSYMSDLDKLEKENDELTRLCR